MTAALPLAGASDAIELLIRATLLIGGAWAAASLLRTAGASAAARHMAWLLGIAGLLALPLIWWLAPDLRLPILPAEAGAAAAPPSAVLQPELAESPASGSPLPGGWIGLLLLAYTVVAAILLLRIAIARRVLERMWREAEPAPDPAWELLLSALSDELLLPRRVELRIAAGPAMPMTWGTLAPRILLPAEALDWPNERRRLVLLHELAHVARRDSLCRSVASLACALYWFHPGAWFAARHMVIEQEHAADDRVLIAGGSASAYARSLLHLATPADSRPSPAHAASMAGMYQLERRLVSIVTPARRDRPSALFLSSSALLASLATLVVAAGVPVSASALPSPLRSEPDDMASNAVAPRPRSEKEALDAAAPPDGILARREAELQRPAGQLGRPQGSAFAASYFENRRLQREASARASSRSSEIAAGQRGPDASDGTSGPAAPAIQRQGETFTLSSAHRQAARTAALVPLHLTSNEVLGPPEPRIAGPSSYPAPTPARARRSPSLLRPQLTLAVGGVPYEL